MSVVEVLHQLGGVAPRATLVRLVGRNSLDRAITAGDVIRLAHGRYGLPEIWRWIKSTGLQRRGRPLSNSVFARYLSMPPWP